MEKTPFTSVFALPPSGDHENGLLPEKRVNMVVHSATTPTSRTGSRF